MKLTVIGTNHSAMTAAACLAEVGHNVCVVCTDGDLLTAKSIIEPTLLDLFDKQQQTQRLWLSEAIKEGINHSDWLFLYLASNELITAQQLIKDIKHYASAAKVLVNASVFALGSSAELKDSLTKNSSHSHNLLALPNFMTEGNYLKSFTKPDRVIIGGEHNCAEQLANILQPFIAQHSVMFMSLISAELVKLATNAMLATRVSFINEIAQIAQACQADMENIRKGLGADARIGYDYLYAGTGFGGYSLDYDVQGLLNSADEYGCDVRLLPAILKSNDYQKEILFRQLWQYFAMDLKGKKIALWGVSYKPNTADILNAPSLAVIAALLGQKALISVYDPLAAQAVKTHFNDDALSIAATALSALADADALLILTEHKAFWRPNFTVMKQTMKKAVIFDGRNLYLPKQMKELGFVYFAVGRSEDEN